MTKRTVDQAISPNDGMYIPGQEAHYFECGHSAIRNIQAALNIAGLQTPNKILDMACGYGRVLRGIKAVYPSAQITACDIDTRAVDFCGETFGVNRAYSNEKFELANQSDSFDLIWCGSLLTHLDQPSWEKFFEKCSERLLQTGLLIFTTHGRYVTRMIEEYGLHYGLQPETARQMVEAFQETGFGYGKYPTKANYGVSVTSPSWVVSFIETFTNLQICLVNEMGWDLHQDVYACFPKQALVDLDIGSYAIQIADREVHETSEVELRALVSESDQRELNQTVAAWVEKNIIRDNKAYGPRVRHILVRELTDRLRAKYAPQDAQRPSGAL